MLEKLSDGDLLEAYNKAINCKLSKDFIELLKKELLKREITYTK
ncbi:sporulation histidine kinase inhibitor Sda [Alkalihalobacterium alkalinitrilicum]|nr:sporulation histidine kinase inhibitor Sda [Alkalihalobacterium alkalinitrilicum]